MKTAFYIRTWANPISVRNSKGQKVVVPFNGIVEAECDYLAPMAGFKLYEPTKEDEDLDIVTVDVDSDDNSEVSVWEYNEGSDDSEEGEEIGLSEEDISYLKGLTNFEWNKVTKNVVLDYLNKSNVDYSEINNERWEYIKFLKKILKEM